MQPMKRTEKTPSRMSSKERNHKRQGECRKSRLMTMISWGVGRGICQSTQRKASSVRLIGGAVVAVVKGCDAIGER